MGWRDNVGTLKMVNIGGIDFRAKGDVDAMKTLEEFDVEGMATSGLPMFKWTRKVAGTKSVDLQMNLDEYNILVNLFETQTPVPITYTAASNISFTGMGFFKLGEYSHGNGTCSTEFMYLKKPVKVG
jgi:hypothetical protein